MSEKTTKATTKTTGEELPVLADTAGVEHTIPVDELKPSAVSRLYRLYQDTPDMEDVFDVFWEVAVKDSPEARKELWGARNAGKAFDLCTAYMVELGKDIGLIGSSEKS